MSQRPLGRNIYSKFRGRRSMLFVTALLAFGGFLGLHYAQAGLGLSLAPDFPLTTTVGADNVAVGLDITNNSTAGEGDPLNLTSITLIPSCGSNSGTTCTSPDPDVFAVSATGTGSNACAGRTFTITEIDPVTGKVQFTPDSTISLAVGQTCQIDFTVDVLKAPTIDALPAVNGVQTIQVGEANAVDPDTQLPGGGFGTDVTRVDQAVPTPVTHIHDASHANITGTTVTAGTTIHDNVSVAAVGNGPVPTGTADFMRFTNATCSGDPAVTQSNVALVAGSAESSVFVTVPGSLSYLVHYDGDANYTAGNAVCEPLSVGKFDSTTATQVHNATHQNITGQSVPFGTMVHDQATVSGPAPVPSGTVNFAVYGNVNCSGDAISNQTNVALVAGVAESTAWKPAVGSYGYIATYNGDSSHNGSTGICEPFTVTKIDSRTATHVHNATHADITNTTVVVGTMVHDNAQVSGNGVDVPTGSVDFALMTGLVCDGQLLSTQNVALNASGIAESTAWSVTTGNYSYAVDYNGDGIYNPSNATCEPFTVAKSNSTTTTQVHNATHQDITNTTVAAGTMVHDKATVSGSGPMPTGSVFFTLFGNLTCSGDAIGASQEVALNASGQAESTAWAATTGDFSYLVRYPGDVNYNSSDATCEPFSVAKLTSTVTTHVHDATHTDITGQTVANGTMVHDNAMVSGASATPTGSVSFWVYGNTTCSGDPISSQLDVALSGGSAESTAWTPTPGGYGYKVTYAGDALYNASTGICEPFTIEEPAAITRTIGFWQTHTQFTINIFQNELGGSITIDSGRKIIDSNAKLFGAFYANIAKMTDGTKRTSIDQARMILLQQLVGAILNCAAFDCSASTQTLIANAQAAYSGNDASLMLSLASQLDAYNNSGDSAPIPAALGPYNPATPQQSKSIADLAFWNHP